MILLIDNYDSFVWNLVHYLGELGETNLQIVRNDEISVSDIDHINPKKIILSPGPCTPSEAGICLDLVSELKGKLPILGICLGHQTIAQACGAKIIRAQEAKHGKTSIVTHDNSGIFHNIPSPISVMRYHSLVIDPAKVPDNLKILATSEDHEIMAIEHRDFSNLIGLQFHPESIMTPEGKPLLNNFLSL
jgi:anthranilate synthase/aminodeoxychorismate synthase-like glutamine amidotransferase